MSRLTTHVLDVSRGQPAAGLAVTLCHRGPQGRWFDVAFASTDDDGRVASLADSLEPGVYRITFATGAYFRALDVPAFHPQVEVTIEIDAANDHYHVPLLISPFGYTTYRGS